MRHLPDHLLVTDDGALYDTRKDGWSSKPLRPIYCRTFRHIDNVQQFKATLRAGAFAWPGGYPLALYTTDGAALCFDCGRKERRNIMDSIKRRLGDGWQVMGCDIEHEGPTNCDHCGKCIQPGPEEE